jgi:hypothetical protein
VLLLVIFNGGKYMTIKDYAGVLKWAIKTQIDYQMEEMQNPNADERFHDGVIVGLQIALEKIDASMFLAKE